MIFRIAAEPLHRAAHGGEIHHQRHAGKILQNDARDHEWNLFVGRLFAFQFGQCFHILAAHLLVRRNCAGPTRARCEC